MAARLGVEPTAEAFARLAPDQIIPVQAAVAEEVAAMPDPDRWGASTAAGGMALAPVLDGDLLTRRPEEAVAAGAGRGVDLLTGSTAEEFRLFLVPTGLIDLITPDLVDLVAGGMGVPRHVVDGYRDRHADLAPGDLLSLIITDGLFRVPAVRLAERQSAHARTWMYEFAWRSPLPGLGACHALELGFVFDTLRGAGKTPMTGPNPPQKLADAMHRAWVDFAAHGDPGWEPYDAETRRVRVFDGDGDPVVQDPRGGDRELWG